VRRRPPPMAPAPAARPPRARKSRSRPRKSLANRPRCGLFRPSLELTRTYAESLAAREQEFSNTAQERGLGYAFARFGRHDAVNVGDSPSFVVGAPAIAAAFPDGPSPFVWSADQGVIVASSGDLGVTWGFLQRTSQQPGRLAQIPFFTIWAREDPTSPWLYIAE